MKLKQKVAIITGGGNGIGKETTFLFAQEGASVVVADYNREAGEEAVKKLTKENYDALFIPCDVANQSSVSEMVKEVVHRFGKIDILINNAGVTQDGLITKLTSEQWHRVIDVNLNGVFFCIHEVAPHMVKEGRGKIINTSSISGVYGNIGQTNYAATKAGVIGITKTLSKELGRKGINVNAVAPGFIRTEMVEKMPKNIIDQMVEKVPLKRLGYPVDVARVYLFLASEDSDYVNGAVIHVDGGIMI